MLISFSDLKSLPVETKSGTYLGKVCDLVLEAQSGRVLQYEVKNGRLRASRLLIAHEQVLEITKTKVVVQDAVVTELAKEREMKKFAKRASPALTSKI